VTALAARRRHPFALVLLIALGLLATGALYAALAPRPAAASTASAGDIEQGHKLFIANCSSCHGLNAEGTQQNAKGEVAGPSLIGVGAAAVDFQVGTGRMPMAQPGAQAARKKPVYNDDEISALGAFVASLGPGPSVPDITQDDIDNADLVEGGAFFRTNCTACHNFAGSGGALPGGKYAPNLRGVSPKHIYEAMLTGPQQMPVFSDGVLTPQDKKDIIAYLKKNEDTPSYGGFTLGSIGPVSEGLFAWIAGIGTLVVVGIWITAKNTRSTRTLKKGDA
jgi:ubiquinol-cytochrome c reductase cytochrome c subunit